MKVIAEHIAVKYVIGDIKNLGLKDVVIQKLTGKRDVREFWAVKDVSFSLQKGDMLGIVGSNGSGKSTLLKVVSGIMRPTRGALTVEGSVAALLELGSGFDSALTVRENTFLRGAMLGYTKKYMREIYGAIIDFAELQDFQDLPFKNLSSGMKSRLAFALASLVEPEILILDEVLAVGDAGFRKKSERKMMDIIAKGTIVLYVSHGAQQVRNLCNKAIWIEKGERRAYGETEAVVDEYEAFLESKG